jgi:hypothetical protein
VSESEQAQTIRPWLRPEHGRAYEAALEWLAPRCRTEQEQRLAPALLLLLAPLNALVAPCRPVAGSSVNFQVTLSRQTAAGAVRVRLTVRGAVAGKPASRQTAGTAASAGSLPELWLNPDDVLRRPLVAAARVLEALLQADAAADD